MITALLEAEKQRIDEITAGWDDPTSADWGNEDRAGDESANAADGRTSADTTAAQAVYKCTALYSYTVIILPIWEQHLCN